MKDNVAIVGERRLKAAGKRITPQRKLVLDTLAQADRHLDASEIYELVRRQDGQLSLATVYRTLNVLKETGVVRELHLEGEQHHYELAGPDEHSHLVCLECGRVIEVDSASLAEAVRLAARSHGFEVAAAQVELTGYCADCSQRRG
jgi:Fe2+ or Zn2+ uptake regulation protein